MTEDREPPDDLDDPEMSDLLRRWGRSVGEGSPSGPEEPAAGRGRLSLFDPPDPRRMHRALDAVDRELAARSLRLRRLRVAGLLAASLAIVAGGWWAVATRSGSGDRISVADLHVSGDETPLRGKEEAAFRSGDRIWLHFTAGGDGFAWVALLDSRMELVPVPPAPREMKRGENAIAFRLDEEAGTESILLLASATPRPPAAIEELIRETAAAIAKVPGTHRERLRAALDLLGRDRSLAIGHATFEHRPR
jgi:hypothetical protein